MNKLDCSATSLTFHIVFLPIVANSSEVLQIHRKKLTSALAKKT